MRTLLPIDDIRYTIFLKIFMMYWHKTVQVIFNSRLTYFLNGCWCFCMLYSNLLFLVLLMSQLDKKKSENIIKWLKMYSFNTTNCMQTKSNLVLSSHKTLFFSNLNYTRIRYFGSIGKLIDVCKSIYIYGIFDILWSSCVEYFNSSKERVCPLLHKQF